MEQWYGENGEADHLALVPVGEEQMLIGFLGGMQKAGFFDECTWENTDHRELFSYLSEGPEASSMPDHLWLVSDSLKAAYQERMGALPEVMQPAGNRVFG